MSTQQQEQTVNTKEHKSLTEKRFIIAIVAILFLIGGATLWILNSQGIIQGSWSGILLIIFTVLGIVIGLFQWLFPVTAPSSQQPIASPPPQPTPSGRVAEGGRLQSGRATVPHGCESRLGVHLRGCSSKAERRVADAPMPVRVRPSTPIRPVRPARSLSCPTFTCGTGHLGP